MAANFSANEAFIGHMTQMNVWDYELPASDFADMARHANTFIGNVVAWSDFYDPADEGIKKVSPSVARTGEKGMYCHGCLALFVYNPNYTSFFAMKLEKLHVNDKITASC